MKDPHRAFVVALFADMTGFRSFAETADPEVLFETLTQYQRFIGTTVDARGGQVVDYSGDGVFSIFNDRVPLAEPEVETAATAIALQDGFTGLAASSRKGDANPIPSSKATAAPKPIALGAVVFALSSFCAGAGLPSALEPESAGFICCCTTLSDFSLSFCM